MFQKTAELKTHLFTAGKDKDIEAAEGRQESGRARGAALRGILSPLTVAILVSGCAAAYVPAPLPVNHPASPAASEAPPPPPQAFRDENILLVPTEEMPAQGPHAGHGTMPGGKNVPSTPVEEMPAQGSHAGHGTMPGGH